MLTVDLLLPQEVYALDVLVLHDEIDICIRQESSTEKGVIADVLELRSLVSIAIIHLGAVCLEIYRTGCFCWHQFDHFLVPRSQI